MIKKSGALSAVLLLLCLLPSLAQKRVPAPVVHFQGAPQFTEQELFAAAGLKPGMRMDPRDVKAHARQLIDTGVFTEVKFKSDRRTQTFILSPTSQLYPMHLENVPLAPGKELDDKLHARFPLYRSQLPASGSMVDGICRTFEEMLAAKGAKTTVKAALTSGLGPQKITALNFTVDSPAVHIGRIQLAGVSPAMEAKASLLASGQTGNSFDTENTAIGLQRAFEDLYQEQGYAAVQVEVAQVDPFIVSDRSIDIPYAVKIREGGVYKLGTIDFPANALVTRTEVEKIVAKVPRGSGRPLDLFVLAVRDAYHAHGYLDATVELHPSFNEATHIVNYGLEIASGSQYRFGSVKFDGAPDAMAAKLKLAWKMAPGDLFDESYLSTFAAQAQKKDKQLAKWMQTVITSYDSKPDAGTHEVDCIFHFAKATEGNTDR